MKNNKKPITDHPVTGRTTSEEAEQLLFDNTKKSSPNSGLDICRNCGEGVKNCWCDETDIETIKPTHPPQVEKIISAYSDLTPREQDFLFDGGW